MNIFIGDVKTGKAPADGTDELPKHARNEGFDEMFPEMAENLAQLDELKTQIEDIRAKIQPLIKTHDGESNGSAATTATSEKAGAEWQTEFCSYKQQTQEKFEEQAETIHGLKNRQQSTNKLASETIEVLKKFTETQAELSHSVTRIHENSSDTKEAIGQLRTEQERHRKILEKLINDEIPAIKSQLEKIQQGSQVSQEPLLVRLEPSQVKMIATQLKEEPRN